MSRSCSWTFLCQAAVGKQSRYWALSVSILYLTEASPENCAELFKAKILLQWEPFCFENHTCHRSCTKSIRDCLKYRAELSLSWRNDFCPPTVPSKQPWPASILSGHSNLFWEQHFAPGETEALFLPSLPGLQESLRARTFYFHFFKD